VVDLGLEIIRKNRGRGNLIFENWVVSWFWGVVMQLQHHFGGVFCKIVFLSSKSFPPLPKMCGLGKWKLLQNTIMSAFWGDETRFPETEFEQNSVSGFIVAKTWLWVRFGRWNWCYLVQPALLSKEGQIPRNILHLQQCGSKGARVKIRAFLRRDSKHAHFFAGIQNTRISSPGFKTRAFLRRDSKHAHFFAGIQNTRITSPGFKKRELLHRDSKNANYKNPDFGANKNK